MGKWLYAQNMFLNVINNEDDYS